MKDKAFMSIGSVVESTIDSPDFWKLKKGEKFIIEKESQFYNGEHWIKVEGKSWLPVVFFKEV